MAFKNTTTGADSFSVKEYPTPDIYAGTCGYESENPIESKDLNIEHYPGTLGANIEKTQKGLISVRRNGKAVSGKLDKNLLSRANEIIEGFDPSEIMDSTINIESLRGIILQLWETAKNATQFHQEILALLESAILNVEILNREQLSVLREAIKDLQNEVLAQAHVDVIRRRFITAGFSPLAILTEIENEDICD